MMILSRINKILQRTLLFILIFMIRFYQFFLSPVLPKSCRFYPSCSHYSIEALKRYGITRGLYLAVRRLLRCHPWCDGGYDPVPERFSL